MDLEDNSRERRKIAEIMAIDYLPSTIEELTKFHIYLLKPWQDFNHPYDCREWVFDEIGLVELTKRVSCVTFSRFGEKLKTGEIRQLGLIETPVPGALAAYANNENRYVHYGVCCGFLNNRIMVDSKWGDLDLFRHDINSVLPWFGYKVDFFSITKK